MPASLSITNNTTSLLNATDNVAPYVSMVDKSITAAFNNLLKYFDYTSNVINLSVIFTDDTSYAASSAPSSLVSFNGSAPGSTVSENAPLHSILVGNAGPASAYMYVSLPWVQNAFATPSNPNPIWKGDDTRAFEHEWNHIIGNDYGNGTSLHDANVTYINGSPFFTGANVEALYGGPAPLDSSLYHFYFDNTTPSNVNHVTSVMDNDQGYPAQPTPQLSWSSTTTTQFDRAMMKDDGVPVLSDNELAGHEVIRLYDAAKVTGESVASVQHMANVYTASGGNALATAKAILSSLGRSTATAATLVSTADKLRASLDINPNISYASTAEESIASLSRLITGHAPTATLYESSLHAVINGGTLQNVAMQFMKDPGYAATYGKDITASSFVHDVYTKAGMPTNPTGEARMIASIMAHPPSRTDMFVIAVASPSEHNIMANLPALTGGGSPNGQHQLLGMLPTLAENHFVG